jgi:ribokinase
MSNDKVVVVGSLACDFVMRVPRRPQKGETVIGTSFDTFVGGKGNNQALACARAGGRTSMVGRVGADGFGDMILQKLDEAGVDHRFVLRDPEVSTGIADILVDADGDNSICVAPQANARLSPADMDAAAAVLGGAGVLLVQLEIPYPTAARAAEIARASGAVVILNPAPAPERGPLPPELVAHVDLVVPNQTEAELLTGIAASDPTRALDAARALQRGGFREVVVTLGELGAVVLDARGTQAHVPAFQVSVEDTTAAGDAFCGALAAALASGKSLGEAALWGSAAGAVACTRLGAEPSLPSRTEIEQLLRTRNRL